MADEQEHPSGVEGVRLVGIVASQERGQPLNRVLEFRVLVDERAHSRGQPLDVELFIAASIFEFLDTAVGEIHLDSCSARGARAHTGGATYTSAGHTGHQRRTRGAGGGVSARGRR